MYGLPGSRIQFGTEPAVDLFTAKLSGADRGAAGAGSAPLKSAQNTQVQQRAIKAKRLYVLVTRKVSVTDGTKDRSGVGKVSLTDETKDTGDGS